MDTGSRFNLNAARVARSCLSRCALAQTRGGEEVVFTESVQPTRSTHNTTGPHPDTSTSPQHRPSHEPCVYAPPRHATSHHVTSTTSTTGETALEAATTTVRCTSTESGHPTPLPRRTRVSQCAPSGSACSPCGTRTGRTDTRTACPRCAVARAPSGDPLAWLRTRSLCKRRCQHQTAIGEPAVKPSEFALLLSRVVATLKTALKRLVRVVCLPMAPLMHPCRRRKRCQAGAHNCSDGKR